MPHETATTILRWRDATGLGLEHAVFEGQGGVNEESLSTSISGAYGQSAHQGRSWVLVAIDRVSEAGDLELVGGARRNPGVDVVGSAQFAFQNQPHRR